MASESAHSQASVGVGESSSNLTVVSIKPTKRNPEVWCNYDLCVMSNGSRKARCKKCGAFFKEEGNTTLKNHSNNYCKAVKYGPGQDQSTMANDATLWRYEAGLVRDRMAKFVIQESLPFDHFDNPRLTKMIQETLQPRYTHDFFEDVGPLLSMQLGDKMLEGLFHVFNSYVRMLIRALPGSMEEEANYEGFRMAETEVQQMTLLANASLLADELLPRAAMKLSPVVQAIYKDDPHRRPTDRQNRNPEQREWKRRLASIVDRLKDSFCRQHALDLIFTEDGDSHLTADIYINMDGIIEEIEWFPSPIFQELYAKLYRMSSIAAEMFVGRERFSTMLLMRLTETVILWLSDDQTFWDDIEEGPTPLGPLGLQQFYLDMKFVISFASQGRYLSRNLNRVVNEIINKALAAFSATGVDPYGVLPEDEWFADICQEAIERLIGKPRLANGERDLSSPTASVSAQSISSIRSHGSS